MPYGWAQDHDVLKEPPVGAYEQVQDENCLSTSRLPAYRPRMSRLRQEVKPLRRTGFNIDLRIHDDKKIDVQSAGRLCLLRDLDRNAFAGIFYAAATAMKAVIIARPEDKPQRVLAGQELTSTRARSFATVPTSGRR